MLQLSGRRPCVPGRCDGGRTWTGGGVVEEMVGGVYFERQRWL